MIKLAWILLGIAFICFVIRKIFEPYELANYTTQQSVYLYSTIGLIISLFASAFLLKQEFKITDIIGIAAILGGVTVLSVYKEKK